MNTKSSRRGAYAIAIALLCTTVLGFLALVMDIGLLRLWRQQLQNAVDAGSHAGTAQLDGTVEGMQRARAVARRVTGQNVVAGKPVDIDLNESNDPAGDIVLGRRINGAFYPYASDPEHVTAVRVVASRKDLRTFVAPTAFAQDEIYDGEIPERDFRRMGLSATSTALGGGAADADCPIPIGLPHCALDVSQNLCSVRTRLNPDNTDNAGWARVGSSRPNARYVKDAINGYCSETTTVEDVLTLNNGVMSSAIGEMAAAVSRSAEMWDTEEWGPLPARQSCSSVPANRYGRVVVGRIPVFRDPSNCTNTKYNGSNLEIVGFATAVVYDVCATGPAKNRGISVRMICEVDSQARAGGGYFGTTVPPRLME